MINREQYEAAYKVGLRKYDEGLDIAAVKKLLKGTRMEETTASILAGNVSYMLKGEVYKRAQSIPATDDYLTWIRRDRSTEEYRNAINSLKDHIVYYESTHEGRRKGLWEILAKHEALANLTVKTAILLEYEDKFSKGYVDILPLDLFAEHGIAKGSVHVVRARSGKKYQAKCDIAVDGVIAELNYEKYPDFNNEQGMSLGVARITFNDSDRTSISNVEWKPEKTNDFSVCRFGLPTFLIAPSPPYIPPLNPSEKSMRLVRERPGQTKFRKDLKSVYNNRCCISGCQVPQVLQAAHIDPYYSDASDNVRNGLLLRSDLHTLFDNHMIGVEPESLHVQLSKVLRSDPHYSDFHGRKLIIASDSSHHPDHGALLRHWGNFQKENKP